MSESFQVGQVEVRQTVDRTVYTRRLFVRQAELASLSPRIDDPADAWTGTANTYVTEIRRESLAGGENGAWLIEVMAEPRSASALTASTELDNREASEYAFGELSFPLSWWGAHRAAAAEAGGHPRDESKAKLNPEGVACRLNEIVYDNATTDSAGAPDYALSPFVAETPSVHPPVLMPWQWKNQDIGCLLFKVTFYLRGNLGNFAGARGVNKANGFPTRSRPFDTRAHKWRLREQSLLSAESRGGEAYALIRRVFQYAPGDLTWDPEKNGGELDWYGR